MTDKELRNLVLDVLAEIAPEVEVAKIETDIELRDQVDIDSMDLLNFVIGVHERTGIDIPEAHYAKLTSIDELVAYLSERFERP